MEDFAQYLLSTKQRTDHHYMIRERQKELDVKNDTHLLICKYHERVWFQRLWHATYTELLGEIYRLARDIEYLENAIDNSKRALFLHRNAVEELHKQMKPYEHINLANTILQQQTFF